jgi:hypothetical protein
MEGLFRTEMLLRNFAPAWFRPETISPPLIRCDMFQRDLNPL